LLNGALFALALSVPERGSVCRHFKDFIISSPIEVDAGDEPSIATVAFYAAFRTVWQRVPVKRVTLKLLRSMEDKPLRAGGLPPAFDM
jgi:hypothetical protein